MRIEPFTHAITRTPIYVDLDLLGAWWHSPASKATHLMLVGGGMAPILESPETVTSAKMAPIKEENNEQA